jgi:hypothetical protein
MSANNSAEMRQDHPKIRSPGAATARPHRSVALDSGGDRVNTDDDREGYLAGLN